MTVAVVEFTDPALFCNVLCREGVQCNVVYLGGFSWEGKSGAEVGIVNRKVARRANIPPTAGICTAAGIHLPGWESRMQLLPTAPSPDGLISARYAVITKTLGREVLTTTSNVNVTQGHGC